jgi:hypoxanthine-DNA glycosylase
VIDSATRVLVLGSLPGAASLAAAQYYAHPRNKFWLLMSEVTGVDLAPLAYTARLQALLEQHVGLWDVVAEANRQGSLDSRIRDRRDNDLLALIATLPALTTIAFNGGTASRLGLKVLGQNAARYRIVQLPSSSPAYTLSYAEKSRLWQALRGY